MNGRRGNSTLFVAVVALLALLVFGLLANDELSLSNDRPSLEIPTDVNEITISRGGERVQLRRGERGWEAHAAEREFPARGARVELLLESLRKASIVRTVTADRALWDRFGVGESAPTVSLVSSSARLDLVVGSATDGEGAFVRMLDESEVYEIDAVLSFFAEQTLGFWLLLRILPEDVGPEDVIALRVQTTGALRAAGAVSSFELFGEGRAVDRWRVADGNGARADITISRSDGLELISDVVDIVGASFWLGDWDELATVGEIVVELADGRAFSLEVRGVGPFVVEPSGPNLPGAPYGGLRYAVATSRLVRATNGADLQASE